MASSSTTKATTFYTQSGTDKAIAAAIAGIKPPDPSGYATKTDLASGLSTRAEIAALSAVKAVADAALPKEEAASTYATASALQAVRKTAEGAAAASGSLDMSGFLKNDDAAATYQPRGDYALRADVPDVSGLAKKTDVPDVSGLATTTALTEGLEGKADRADVPDVSGYETSEHAASTYQPKGEYALASDLEMKADAAALSTKANASDLAAVKKTADAAAPASAIPDVSGLISKTDADKAYQVKGDYATHADVTQAVANAAISGTVNLSGYATTGDLDAVRAVADDALTPAEADKVYQPKGDYATASSVSDALNSKADVSAIPDVSGFATKSDADTKYQGKGSYATTSDLSLKADASALDSYETSAHAAAAYQPKGSYALKTDVPDVSGLATTTALTEGLAGKANATALAAVKETADAALPTATAASTYATSSSLTKGLAGKVDSTALASYETAAHAAETYQPKGDYATTAVVDQKIASVPVTDLSGYVQGAELAEYAKKTDIPDVSGLAKGDTGVGVVSILDEDRDGVATVTLTDGTTGSLRLPPGPQGDPGVGVASVTNPDGDAQALVTLTDGTTSSLPLPTVATPQFTASASTLAAGASATASVNGTYPNLTLALGIPRGATGATGAPGAIGTASTYMLVGPGRPDVASTTGGVITGSEPVGAVFRSTDGASVGAWAWEKRADGAWYTTSADTGWLDVTSQCFVHETAKYCVRNGAYAGVALRLTRDLMMLQVAGSGGGMNPGEIITSGQHLCVPVLKSLLSPSFVWNSYTGLPAGLQEYFGYISIVWNKVANHAQWILPRDPSKWVTTAPGTSW